MNPSAQVRTTSGAGIPGHRVGLDARQRATLDDGAIVNDSAPYILDVSNAMSFGGVVMNTFVKRHV